MSQDVLGTLQYRGYNGSVEYSPEDQVYFGKILGTRDLFSYEGNTLDELNADFCEAVNAFLEMAGSNPPDMPDLVVEVDAQLYEAVCKIARDNSMTIARVVDEFIWWCIVEKARGEPIMLIERWANSLKPYTNRSESEE